DADIYGPSTPTLFGLKDKQPAVDAEKRNLIALEKFGIKVMYIRVLMPDIDAVMWRGPMVHKMLEQFIKDVDWGELDTLLIDLPPGTGDTQLSLSQLIPLSGAVIVTTPQDLALADVVRGVAMFQKVGVPLSGVVEKMSYFSCPHCAGRSEIFSHGGGRRKAEELKVPFLGEIPLDPQTREGSDGGPPIGAGVPESRQSQRFLKTAEALLTELKKTQAGGEAVKIQL